MLIMHSDITFICHATQSKECINSWHLPSAALRPIQGQLAVVW